MAVKSVFSTPFKQQLEAYNSKMRWANYSASDPISYLSAYKVSVLYLFYQLTVIYEGKL